MSGQMRLLYLSAARLPTEKAHGYQIIKMCEAFVANGVQVTLIHPHVKQKDPALEISPFDYYGVPPVFDIQTLKGIDGLAIARRISPDLSPYGFRLLRWTHLLNSIRFTMPFWSNPQVCYFGRDLMTIVVLSWFRRFIRGRIVFEAHTLPASQMQLIVHSLNRLDVLLTITVQLKRLFVEAGVSERRISVAPDAVDLEQFQISDSRQACRQRLGLPTKRPIIGYVGRFQTMGQEKGIPELIRAMAYLPVIQGQEPLLLCVGGPLDSVPSYLDLAAQVGVPESRLRFVDRVPNVEVPYWMRACDVVTIPFPWNEHMAYYTSPMKLFEYMAVGTPIIASDLPALGEILEHEHNAILVTPGDPQALAVGIKQILTDSALAQRISEQALEDVRRHTWNSRAQSILKAISNGLTG